MLVQAFRPELAVEGLDERVVRWFAGPAEVERDAADVRPQIQVARDKLAALVDADRCRITYLGTHPFEHLYDVRRPEAEPRHHRRREPAKGIDHRQDAQLRPRRELTWTKSMTHTSFEQDAAQRPSLSFAFT
jgi:hypothetical protein